MKTRLLCALLWITPAAAPAASFEGKISFKITADRGAVQELTHQIKGDKIRMEVGGQQEMGGMIADMGKRQNIMLMDSQRMYMVMDMPDVVAQAAVTNPDDVKLEKTGETAKIAGYEATKYIVTQEGRKTDLWLAEGLGTFMSMPEGNPMGGGRGKPRAGRDWERALAGKDLFPMRVIGYDPRGRENFRMEVTAVEKQSLPDSLFVPPAGYQKFDMGGMMRGMMPGGMPGGNRR